MLTWSLHFIDLETYGAESLRCLCEWFCLWFQPDVVWFCVVPQDDSDAWKFRSTCASAGSDEIGETDNIVWYNLYIQLTDEKPPFWNEATAACLVDPKIEVNLSTTAVGWTNTTGFSQCVWFAETLPVCSAPCCINLMNCYLLLSTRFASMANNRWTWTAFRSD